MPIYFCDFHSTFHDDDTTPAVETQPDVFVCEAAAPKPDDVPEPTTPSDADDDMN